MRRVLMLALGALISATAIAAAQQSDSSAAATTATPAPPRTLTTQLRDRVNGSMSIYNELYGTSSDDLRRPGSTWRFMASPRFRLLGATEFGLDITLSTEGSDLRQGINQIALEPSWNWGQAHAGYFTRNYTSYTMEGLRILGGGLDVHFPKIRASVQAGRSQSALPATIDGSTYERTVIGGSVGYGKESGTFFDIRLVRARDDSTSAAPPAIDTLGLDTLAADLRPQGINRPQSNAVVSVGGQLALLRRTLRIQGEVAGGLVTRDLGAPKVNTDSVSVPLNGLGETRTSSSADVAWKVEGMYNRALYGLRAGYERVNPGFTSLGVAYLISDRLAWHADGNLNLLKGGLVLQGRYQTQHDNLRGQKLFTTTRDMVTAAVMGRLTNGVTLTAVGLLNSGLNDAANDTLLVDNRSTALNPAIGIPWRLARRGALLSVGYGFQMSEDKNPIRRIPRTLVHTANVAVTLPVTANVSITPMGSAVLANGAGGGDNQRNVLGGCRVAAKFINGKLGVTGQFTQTFVAAREVTGGMGQLSYTLPWQLALSVQGRYNRYGAIGSRPAFNERFLTSTVSRSF